MIRSEKIFYKKVNNKFRIKGTYIRIHDYRSKCNSAILESDKGGVYENHSECLSAGQAV